MYNQQYYGVQPKKSKLSIILAIIAIMLLMCCGGIGLLINLVLGVAKEREPIDFKELTVAMSDLGYIGYEHNTDTYMAFHTEDYTTELNVYNMGSEMAARYEAEELIELYEFEDADVRSSRTGKNYERYRWKKSAAYYLVYRVEDKLVVVYSDSKESIDKIVDKMNF